MSRKERNLFVASRAGFRCEYCKMDESLQGATFHVEHHTPRSKRGSHGLENLVYACWRCNARKSIRMKIIDADSGREYPIFNPRTQNWSDHFEWVGLEIIGLTEQGRAMIENFDYNSFKRITIREGERRAGKHPPPD